MKTWTVMVILVVGWAGSCMIPFWVARLREVSSQGEVQLEPVVVHYEGSGRYKTSMETAPPDPPANMTEREEELWHALECALQTIQGYEFNVKKAGLDKKGFCQEEAYLKAVDRIKKVLYK